MDEVTITVGILGAGASVALAGELVRQWLVLRRAFSRSKQLTGAALEEVQVVDPIVQEWISNVDREHQGLAKEIAQSFTESIHPMDDQEIARLYKTVQVSAGEGGTSAEAPPTGGFDPLGVPSDEDLAEEPEGEATDSVAVNAALQVARDELDHKMDVLLERESRYQLDRRELAVLHLLVSGRSVPEIAWWLGISPTVTRMVESRLRSKVGASSRVELVARSLREGLVD